MPSLLLLLACGADPGTPTPPTASAAWTEVEGALRLDALDARALGEGVAILDLTGDGLPEVVVGAPSTHLDPCDEAGAVFVFDAGLAEGAVPVASLEGPHGFGARLQGWDEGLLVTADEGFAVFDGPWDGARAVGDARAWVTAWAFDLTSCAVEGFGAPGVCGAASLGFQGPTPNLLVWGPDLHDVAGPSVSSSYAVAHRDDALFVLGLDGSIARFDLPLGPASTATASVSRAVVEGGVPRLHTADLDGDGSLDLLFAMPAGTGPATLEVFPGGDLGSSWTLPATGFAGGIGFGDFDGDGEVDLAAGFEDGVRVVRGPIGPESPTARTIPAPEAIGRFAASLAAGDLDGDGRDELLVGAPGDRPADGASCDGASGAAWLFADVLPPG